MVVINKIKNKFIPAGVPPSSIPVQLGGTVPPSNVQGGPSPDQGVQLAPPVTPQPDPVQTPETDPYAEGNSLIDQQAGADTAAAEADRARIGSSYDQQKADVIRSYQQALDDINMNLKAVGITTRGQYAGRNLYDASGEVSGIGQGVAAQNVSPYMTQLGRMPGDQAADLGKVETGRRNALSGVNQQLKKIPITAAQKKFDLKNSILKGIQDAADKKQADDYRMAQDAADEDFRNRKFNYDVDKDNQERVDKFVADTSKKTDASKKAQAAQESKGRKYVTSVKEYDKLKKQFGPEAFVKIGGKTYLKSPEERLAYSRSQVALGKALKTKGSGTKTPKPTVLGTTRKVPDAGGGTQFQRKNKDGTFTNITAAQYANQNGMNLGDVLAEDANFNNNVKPYMQSLVDQGKSDEAIASELEKKFPYIFRE